MKRTPLQRKTGLKAKTGFTRKVVKKVKKKTPTITLLKKKLWDECKRIIRERHGSTCYTCGRTGLEGSNRHTGHFISSSICSVELRYDLDNLRPQCYACNIHKSGNWLAFETHLMIEKGRDFPTELKARNELTKGKQYDILYYQTKLDEYKQL